ncbi:MAG: hypothetical protein R3A51_01645 [Nannocystaceae bacterium]
MNEANAPSPAEVEALRRRLAAAVFAVVDGGPAELPADVAQVLQDTHGIAYVCLRRGGRALAEAWSSGHQETWAAALCQALARARGGVTGARASVDAVEVCLGLAPERARIDKDRAALASHERRGIAGLELTCAAGRERFAPTAQIARNRRTEKWLEAAQKALGLSDAQLAGDDVTLSRFPCAQQLITRADLTVHPLLRGKPLVEPTAITRAGVRELEALWADFLVRGVQPDGRMQYIYYPSRGEEDRKRNNMIRQWMATLALIRLARRRGDKRLIKLADDNLRFNLRAFYRPSGKLGLIEYNHKVKLGAVALAVLSIVEHPQRKQLKRVEPRLWATIDHLWRPGGAFRTFFKPAERNDVQNFYPGEALLAWAARLCEGDDPALYERFMASFHHYRDWHRAQRNPAFVPWHTQAYYEVWRRTGEAALRDFIFEMNDWLLAMQQWDDVAAPDARGRFYDPRHPEYGPPHASATGVYLEGLIDAFALAREVGDSARVAAYRQAILRGLRSARQLTFFGDVDMFYVSKRDALRGGVRNTVYDNVVRVDNVQHNLMAVFKVLDRFTDDDFAAVDRE